MRDELEELITQINSILVQKSEVAAKLNPNVADICPLHQSTFRSVPRDRYVNMGIRALHMEMRSERSVSRKQ